MKTITLIAKGPSAVHAPKYIGDSDVGTINDSGRFCTGDIHYAFSSDGLSRFSSHYQRIKRIVTPARAFDLPEWYDPGTHITYNDDACRGDDAAFRERIQEGGICHHHTTTGAMHFLAKVPCYDRVKIIGVDGGHKYAPGALVNKPAMLHLRSRLGLDFLTEWKIITQRLASILTETYGTEFEFYEVHHPG